MPEPGAPEPLVPAPTPQPPVALYLHVPFCVSHCPYCDFVVYAGADARGPRSRMDVFTRALAAEISLRADALDARFGPPGAGGCCVDGDRPPLASLYLGGGTPSLLPGESVAELIGLVRRRFGIADGAEVTIECNPGPDERGDLAAFARAGVTRLSIGAQSLDAGELRGIGRRHAPDDIRQTVEEARAARIGQVSLDLLYDLPGQSLESWRATLEGALALEPDHLSCYALTLDDPDEEGITGELGDHLPTPPGARRWRERARAGQDDDRATEQYQLTEAVLGAAGFGWYELSNWARPGCSSRHNLAYWRRLPYEAAGPGAHAFDGVTRRWNAARLDRYVAALLPASDSGAEPTLPPGSSEVVDAAGAESERLILGLRTSNGVASSDPGVLARADLFTWAADAGLTEAGANGRLRLSLRGRLLSNELFSRVL